MFAATMRTMKLANQKQGWLRYWHVVYLLFILAAFGGPSQSTAEETRPPDSEKNAENRDSWAFELTLWTSL